MARKPRIMLYEGYYHVIQSGNDRRKVFVTYYRRVIFLSFGGLVES